jgi:hypothetical protein
VNKITGKNNISDEAMDAAQKLAEESKKED